MARALHKQFLRAENTIMEDCLMKAATRLNGMVKALLLGLLVAAYVLAPASVIPVLADGSSTGQPGTPPEDSTAHKYVVDDPVAVDDVLLTESRFLSTLRFVDF
jgi:hypothetical protein